MLALTRRPMPRPIGLDLDRMLTEPNFKKPVHIKHDTLYTYTDNADTELKYSTSVCVQNTATESAHCTKEVFCLAYKL